MTLSGRHCRAPLPVTIPGRHCCGLAYFDVPVNWSSFATGAVILAAVALDSLIRGRRRHRRTGLDL